MEKQKILGLNSNKTPKPYQFYQNLNVIKEGLQENLSHKWLY